jgi:heme exporter protein A
VGDLISDDESIPILKATQLGYRRGDEWLFRDLNFHLLPGELLWLRGQNGRGKTSLLRLVVSLAHPDEGEFKWAQVGDSDEENNHPIALYIGHANGLKDDLTALESLQFLANLHGLAADDTHLASALKKFSMYSRRHQLTRTLSQGQRRRVALARLALGAGVAVWVLDEPFDTLDQSGISLLRELIDGHCAMGGSVLLTSHIPLGDGNRPVREINLDGATQA